MKPLLYRDAAFLPMITKAGTVYFGPAPMWGALTELKSIGVQLVWNLGEELEWLLKREKEKFEVIWTPIQDYSIPDHEEFERDLNRVVEKIRGGALTFVHCCGGHGRTGMALAALLVKLEGKAVPEALQQAQAHCHGPEEAEQLAFITEFFK